MAKDLTAYQPPPQSCVVGGSVLPFWQKYNLTVSEAAQYFHIGEKRLRRLVEDNPSADYVIMVGAKVLIKRVLFEKFINETNAL